MKSILFLILVVLSSSSIAADEISGANDVRHPVASMDTQSNIATPAYYDDEKNLAKLAEKISSLNKDKRDALEILEKVDSFYSKSFYNLLMLILALTSIVGLLIPIIISAYQTKLLKGQTINLQQTITNEVASKLSELKETLYADNEKKMLELEGDVKKIIEKMEAEYKVEIKNLRAESLARINHVSAATCFVNKEYGTAAKFYFRAALNYMKYNNHSGIRNVTNFLIKNVMAKIPSDHETPQLDERYNKFIKELSSFNTESIYNDAISELKSAWDDFEKRAKRSK
ncbi:hypothetical protein H4F51_14365 [Pectobacterium brasiliense]|uniref:Uncharacterized protein n=1 Tax=Pectobacterium wasabiae TaxID=55208 RepID=A0AAW3EL65_9GAMM|nr:MULTISPECIES: hypothetical protein [Pectobacterium]AOR65129.1 hypothetical protein A7983_18075 [Pectobacterium wasabiae CFBP 3304]EJS96564.1 Hypothetical protein Y17_0442 [Pectobacterium wasabiae CFBP 3304]KFX09609.1 hypothetical protein JV38_01380 [Pectobacterium wasabiae]KGA29811.1 hypothetical protein KU73_05105 [Pectobacterium wasabiae]MBA0196327.1 hypothetical protein [Pectobacterium brasiliense]